MSERRSRVGAWLILPGLALIAIFAWGLGDLVWKSLHSYDSYLNQQGSVSTSQYREILHGPNAFFYRTVFTRTLVLSVLVTLGAVLGAIPVAYYITRTTSRMLRLAALMLALIPFLVGEVVRAFGWLLLLGRNGALGWLAGIFGADSFTLIGTTLGIWLGAVQTMLPIAVFVLLPAMRKVEPDLERAAGTLGARPAKVWLQIVLPLVRPGLTAATVVVFALTMTEYAIPDILGGGVMPFSANAIQSAFFMQGNIVLGSALAVLLLVVVIAVVVAVLTFGGRARRRPAAVDKAVTA